MLESIPTEQELEELLGQEKLSVWKAVRALVEELYEMEILWNRGGKAWTYECKYRRGGKTLCALYARENCFGFLAVFGKAEQEKFEQERPSFSPAVQAVFDGCRAYHDGKWLMLEPEDESLLEDMRRLLAIKRKPNRKKGESPAS